ncbi:MAG: outer membrane beta-barrel protein, partial [Bacteroidia bacterium]
MKEHLLILSLLLICISLPSQTDTLVKKLLPDSNLTFTGTRISEKEGEFDPSGKITYSGYISAYYAYYTDSSGISGYQKFPTVAPRNNQLGLNIVQLSAKYQSQKVRGMFTLHYGDIPQSAWSPQFNLVQEANVGFRLLKKLWFDAGFFRTHIGLESIQPRENITVSLATTTYFEPYFMSGAKLTWQPNDKLTLQLNAFNGFNAFVETNRNKAFGASMVYQPNEHFTLTFNTITCDESPDHFPRKQQRIYNNLHVVYKGKNLTIGAEANFGAEQHSRLKDTNATATMFSALLAVKYRIKKGFSIYGRGEYFSDDNEILTGPLENDDHKFIGLNIAGITLGFEEKLIYNSYIRLEGRYLTTLKPDEKIFYYQSYSTNERYEG